MAILKSVYKKKKKTSREDKGVQKSSYAGVALA